MQDWKNTYKPIPTGNKIKDQILGEYLYLIHQRESIEIMKQHYVMYIWTLLDDNTLVPGKKFCNAVGFIICENPCDIESNEKVHITQT